MTLIYAYAGTQVRGITAALSLFSKERALLDSTPACVAGARASCCMAKQPRRYALDARYMALLLAPIAAARAIFTIARAATRVVLARNSMLVAGREAGAGIRYDRGAGELLEAVKIRQHQVVTADAGGMLPPPQDSMAYF